MLTSAHPAGLAVCLLLTLLLSAQGQTAAADQSAANADASSLDLTQAHTGLRLPLFPDDADTPAPDDSETDPGHPTVDIYSPEPERRTSTAIVVLPGGGYGSLAMDHEGRDIGEHFQDLGITAFVVRYRHAPRYRHPVPLQDARRAIRFVRHHADFDRIGIMGFSAGGHLAASAATLFQDANPDADDPVDRHSSRPDFLILCYPVITFTQDAHVARSSRGNLLGDNPDPELIEAMSVERRVTAATPPTFLFHTDEDTVVTPENSTLFYLALREHDVPAELHIHRPGPHGVGLAQEHPTLRIWPSLLTHWMVEMDYLPADRLDTPPAHR